MQHERFFFLGSLFCNRMRPLSCMFCLFLKCLKTLKENIIFFISLKLPFLSMMSLSTNILVLFYKIEAFDYFKYILIFFFLLFLPPRQSVYLRCMMVLVFSQHSPWECQVHIPQTGHLNATRAKQLNDVVKEKRYDVLS